MSASQRLQLPLTRPLRGVRAHAVPATAAPVSARATQLLQLREQAEKQAEQRDARRRVFAALDEALRTLPAVVTVRLDEIAAMVGELALAVAGEVIGAALAQGMVDPTPIVARCLRDATDGSVQTPLQVYLSPGDHALVQASIGEDPDLARRAAAVTFTADHTLASGAVRVESGAGRLLYDPVEVFGRVAAEIRKGCGS